MLVKLIVGGKGFTTELSQGYEYEDAKELYLNRKMFDYKVDKVLEVLEVYDYGVKTVDIDYDRERITFNDIEGNSISIHYKNGKVLDDFPTENETKVYDFVMSYIENINI